MEHIIEQVKSTGLFTNTTVDYWVEWMSACQAVPDNPQDFIDFIKENEEYVGKGLHEIIPANWRKD